MEYIIATHGKLADGFKSAISVIVGNANNIHTICAYVDGNNDVTQMLLNEINKIGEDKKIIIFTDVMFGSVNQNVVINVNNKHNIRAITGANLVLMLDVILQGDNVTDESLKRAVEEAKNTISILDTF